MLYLRNTGLSRIGFALVWCVVEKQHGGGWSAVAVKYLLVPHSRRKSEIRLLLIANPSAKKGGTCCIDVGYEYPGTRVWVVLFEREPLVYLDYALLAPESRALFTLSAVSSRHWQRAT